MEINDAFVYALCAHEREERAKAIQEATEDACGAILETLNDYPTEIWGAALGAAVAGLFKAKLTAEEMAEEEKAVKKNQVRPRDLLQNRPHAVKITVTLRRRKNSIRKNRPGRSPKAPDAVSADENKSSINLEYSIA